MRMDGVTVCERHEKEHAEYIRIAIRYRLRSIVTAGQSFQPGSKNFKDQLPLFLEGKFKDVLFYKEDVLKNAAREYHPGME